jgi:uncharacterized protein DUF4325
MIVRIKIVSETGEFAEDKDAARAIRVKKLLPTLGEGKPVILDFRNVRYATQSYIHALVGEAIKRYGEAALDLISFKNCSSQLQSVISLVVDYSLSGFPQQPMVANGATKIVEPKPRNSRK